MAERRLDYLWPAFAVLCLGGMVLADEWQTVPFHFIWISLSLVFGLRLWSRRGTRVALIFVVVSTTIVMILIGEWGQDPAEFTEVPLMAAVFLAMVWHARRRQHAIEELAGAHEREREFLRDASHSLRTPLTVAFGHVQLVHGTLPAGSEARDDLGVALDELRRLTRTSERLLTLAASDHAEFLALAPLDPAALAEEVARRWSVASGRAVEAIAKRGPEIVADAERVREALDALVENALRASPPGAPVTVTVRREGDEVAFEVRDRGAGIDPDDLARLFEPFARPRGDRGRGTGLGLAIVRAIAQAHRGSVDADSAPGRGSVFTLRLGPARAATPVAPAAPAPSAQPVSMISMR